MIRAKTLLDLASAANLTIATAESCTGGMVAAAITEVAGSSAIFERGFVTYTNIAKKQMLGVSTATLNAYGAVSEQVAREMAIGAVAHSNADIAVSITGIAGPGGSDYKPEGRVCFGLHTSQETRVITEEFGPLGRANVRKAATDYALDLLISAVKSYASR